MNFKQWLVESVTVSVKDAINEDPPSNIYDLSTYIKEKLRAIPGFNDGTNPELFTIDGYATDSPEGVLNFYPQGIPEKQIPKILQGALYYLDSLKVKHGEPKHDKSGMFKGEDVIRIPVKISPFERKNAPEMNMANGMADHLFRMLNMDSFVNNSNMHGSSISAHDLLIKIDSMPDFQISQNVVKPSVSGKNKNFHDFGMDEDRIRRNLEQLRAIAKWAIDNDYTELELS
jgi:hypothetical protein